MNGWVKFAIVLGAVAILAVILLQKCWTPPSHASDKKGVDSAALDKAYHEQLNARIEQLTGDSMRLADSIDNLIREHELFEDALTLQGGNIQESLQRYDSAKVVHDTVWMLKDCDVLAGEVKLAKVAVEEYSANNDSLIALITEQGKIKDSTIAVWKLAYLHADSTVAFEHGKYDTLYSDYKKTSRKLKVSQITGKIGWGTAIAAFIAGLLIKH